MSSAMLISAEDDLCGRVRPDIERCAAAAQPRSQQGSTRRSRLGRVVSVVRVVATACVSSLAIATVVTVANVVSSAKDKTAAGLFLNETDDDPWSNLTIITEEVLDMEEAPRLFDFPGANNIWSMSPNDTELSALILPRHSLTNTTDS